MQFIDDGLLFKYLFYNTTLCKVSKGGIVGETITGVRNLNRIIAFILLIGHMQSCGLEVC